MAAPRPSSARGAWYRGRATLASAITKSALASTSLRFTSMTPGPVTRCSPSRSVSSTRYWPGFTLKVKPPAVLVRTRWRSFVAVLTTSIVRPSIELVPRGPRTVPLIVPSVRSGSCPVSTTATPRRHAARLSSVAAATPTQNALARCARWQLTALTPILPVDSASQGPPHTGLNDPLFGIGRRSGSVTEDYRSPIVRLRRGLSGALTRPPPGAQCGSDNTRKNSIGSSAHKWPP
jgi:hypothetical protein